MTAIGCAAGAVGLLLTWAGWDLWCLWADARKRRGQR